MQRLFVGLVALLAMAGANRATADTIVDTVGSDTFTYGNGNDVSNTADVTQSVAVGFSSGSDALVENILAYISIPGGNSFTLGLMTSSAGVPSGTFVSGDSIHLNSTSGSPVNETSLNWSVTAGTTYWLVAIADSGSQVMWQTSRTAANDWTFNSTGTGTGWVAPISTFPPEVRITGAASVPGPVTGAGLPGLIFASGGLLVWYLRKRRAQALLV